MDRDYFLVAIVFIVTAPLRAQVIPVNTRDSGPQCNPSVATSTGGDFVVAWSSYYSSSGRSNEIIVRRFDAAGNPLHAEEFQANITRAGNQTEPAVAVGPDGDFMVVWEGPGPSGTDIFARLFDRDGLPLTDELLVNAEVPGQRKCPRVAVGSNESFVVVWEDKAASIAGVATVWGQAFDATGSKEGREFLVAADPWDCRYPDVAADAAGNFVVVWLADRTNRSVHGRLFNAEGQTLTDAFEVSEVDFSSITRPMVAMDSYGRFVATWDGDPNLASLDDVHARCFEPNGLPRGNQFTVNATRDGAQQWPRVAINDANQVAFVWQHEPDDPNLASSVQARRFELVGRAVGEEFELVASGSNRQRYPDVALATDGTLVAVWESAEPDNSDYDIVATIEPPVVRPDLNGDAYIDLLDFQILAESWRRVRDGVGADLDGNGRTDTRDLEILFRHWLR